MAASGEELRLGGRRALVLALLLPAVLLGGMGIKALAALHVGSSGPDRPSPRSGAALVADLAHHDLVLFGGEDVHGELGDTWTWDGDRWTLHHPRISPPPQQDAHLVYDGAAHRVLLLGGSVIPTRGEGDGVPLEEAWAWDGGQWHEGIDGWQPGGTPQNALVAWDARRSDLVVVDLVTSTKIVQNTHAPQCNVFNTVVRQQGKQVVVPMRICAAPAIMLQNETVLRAWTRHGGRWEEHGDVPLGAMYQPELLAPDTASGGVVLFGSDQPRTCYTAESSSVGDATPAAGVAPPATTPVPGPQTMPGGAAHGDSPATNAPPLPPISVPTTPIENSPCSQPPLAPGDPCTGPNDGVAPEQWLWNGATWRTVAARGLPCGFHADDMIQDPATGHLMLRAGTDFWRWDGRQWRRMAGVADFGDRRDFALAADPERHQVVLFGGERAGMHGNDLWSWDGHRWTQREGTPPPTPVPHGADGGDDTPMTAPRQDQPEQLPGIP